MEENNQIKNLIIDMDGVLWKGETPMSGLVEFFDTLRRKHKGFVLATNNATKTTDQYVEKLANFGVEIPNFQVLTSSEATAQFIRRQYPARKKAYIVGEIGLQKAMPAPGRISSWLV
jgi:4-nitrophenyl phosphatase